MLQREETNKLYSLNNNAKNTGIIIFTDKYHEEKSIC